MPGEPSPLDEPLDEVVARTTLRDRPALVAVDGVDGSGKTTFAAALHGRYAAAGRPCLVVHLDDFFNPRAVRYRLGRDSPQGFFLDTYDLATFSTLVLDPLGRSGVAGIVPRGFDHRTDQRVRVPAVIVPSLAVVVVEGMFLHRDELRSRWDLSVFLDVPFDVTARRMAERDGSEPDPEHPSMRRYVEGQRLYMSACDPRARATVVIGSS